MKLNIILFLVVEACCLVTLVLTSDPLTIVAGLLVTVFWIVN